MGMAASQARYLGLTARKTNVEYEGQQINQARTALANQSANLWNRMLALSVPTAPKTTDYTTQSYSFSDGFNDYEIDNWSSCNKVIDGEKYNYQVTYHYNQDVFKALQMKNTNPQVQKVELKNGIYDTERNAFVTKDTENNTYNVINSTGTQAQQFKVCNESDLNNLKILEKQGLISIDNIENFYKTEIQDDKTGEITTAYAQKRQLENISKSPMQIGDVTAYAIQTDYNYKLGNSNAERYDETDVEQKAALEQIRHDFPELAKIPDEKIWTYVKNGQTLFATEADLDKSIASGMANQANNKYQISSNIDYQTGLNQYYATNITEKITSKEYARLDDASGSGRFSSIKLENSSGEFIIHSESKTDDAAYNNAMNQYHYDVLKYEKELEDINAKTSKIQVQDRTLELRLRQLDTEQKALSTEMDAVKGVIQKNIESTFKTFSS